MELLTIEDPDDIQEEENDLPQFAIGIDFGTTNSAVSISVNGQARTIGEIEQTIITFTENGNIYYGNEAKKYRNNGNKKTVSSVKRFISSDKKWDIFGKDYSPEEIATLYIKWLKEKTEKQINNKITACVMTVPAYFDEVKRQIIKQSAQNAGLEVMRVINEPTAAALSYNIDNSKEGKYAIFDLGGGTFDISIINMRHGVLKVIASGGDDNLGGDDFDQKIADKLNIDTAHARRIKEHLTDNEQYKKEGIKITREEFNQITQELTNHTLEIFKRTLRDAKARQGDIKGIVLVGGSTRMPVIAQTLKEEFNTPVLKNLDPDSIVSLGASILAERLYNKVDASGLLLDVTPLSLGMETYGGLVQKIIPRNSRVPISKAQSFTTFADGQTAMSINVIQGERELVQDCRQIGKFSIKGLTPRPAGLTKVMIKFSLDIEGILTVTAQEEESDNIITVDIKPSYNLKFDNVSEMIRDSLKSGKEDMKLRLTLEAKIEAETSIKEINKAIKMDGEILKEEEKEQIISSRDRLLKLISKDVKELNKEEIHKETVNLNKVSEDFVTRRIGHRLANNN